MTDHTQPYTIVVGVSATSKSPTALHWATELAALRGGRVVAVRAWRPTPPQTTSRVTPSPITEDVSSARAQALADLEADVAEVLGGQHGAEVQLVQGGKRKGLVAAAQHADLLVVDAPRRLDRGSLPGFAQRLVYTAPCPVVVMPPSVSGAPRTAVERVAGTVARNVTEAAGRAGRPGLSHPQPPS
ncbi:Nucleotide-binding universal stress protein, UspA family [Pedococcus dokdonensis]|uniref:Nucleotide-binding universal stress protein, UspA family n=1 Tax=Pedococcus dokdonensis TaxID=443156 RepID=A0A1H0S5H6_9MICO|nr:universal stress protein [Pedococcus dokdonensis]SDP36875.1 Nucleotide-binding universal stress protein, UspA family [Pedococcus dokdonensis]